MCCSCRWISLAGLLGCLIGMAWPAAARTLPSTRPTTVPTTGPVSVIDGGDLSATMVTVNVKDATIEACIAEFVRQTGYSIIPFDGPSWPQGLPDKVSLSIENKPFWEALREFCLKTGLTLGPNYAECRLMLAPEQRMGQNLMRYPSTVSGSFLAIITSLQRTNTVDLATPDTVVRNVTLSMQVHVEPKVRVVTYSYYPEIEEAVDENGNSLVNNVMRNAVGMQRIGGNRGRIWNTSIPLRYPEGKAGQTIARLRGKLRCQVQTRAEVAEIPNLMQAKDVTRTLAGRRILLKGVKKATEPFFQVTVVFYREGLTPQQFQELIGNPGIRLVDEQTGREYTFNGTTSSSSDGKSHEAVMLFYSRPEFRAGPPATSDPTKLIWEIPTETAEKAVSFEFKDLPLP